MEEGDIAIIGRDCVYGSFRYFCLYSEMTALSLVILYKFVG